MKAYIGRRKKPKTLTPKVFKSSRNLDPRADISFFDKNIKVLMYNPSIKKYFKGLSGKEGARGLLDVVNVFSKRNYFVEKGLIDKKYNKVKFYKDPFNRFSVRVMPDKYNVYGVKSGYSNFQRLEIKIKVGKKVKRFFLKEYRKNMSIFENATNESLILDLLKKNGINVLKPQFVFDNINFTNHIENRGFIAYDFTNLKTLHDLKTSKSKLLSLDQIKQIEKKTLTLQKQFSDALGFKIEDIHAQNIFVGKDKDGVKLYFSDLFSNIPITEMYFLSKKQGIVK